VVTIKLPALPSGLLSNLLGLLGLVAVVVAVGGLTHNWWWSLLTAGLVATALSYIAQLNAAAVEEEPEVTADITHLARSRSA
jgi:hypothetical protein